MTMNNDIDSQLLQLKVYVFSSYPKNIIHSEQRGRSRKFFLLLWVAISEYQLGFFQSH